MRSVKSVLLCVAAGVISSAAWAQADPQVVIEVVPVPGNEQVTLSRLAGIGGEPLVTYAAYRAKITNNAASALNRVFLTGEALNFQGSNPVIYDSAIVPTGASCGAGNANNKVACDLGSLAPGGGSVEVFVVFQAPINGTRIDFIWRAGGFEGNGGNNGCCSKSDTAYTGLIDPATNISDFKIKATTFLKPGGTKKLFTGNEAITDAGDGWTTIVEVPDFSASTLPWAVASIVENQSSNSCAPYALGAGCFDSTLTIDNYSSGLIITIRWDKAFFKLGSTKPEDVKLRYTGSNLMAITYPIDVQLCSADVSTHGSAPTLGRPCLDEPPKILRNADTPVKELWGDMQWRVKASDNGKYEN